MSQNPEDLLASLIEEARLLPADPAVPRHTLEHRLQETITDAPGCVLVANDAAQIVGASAMLLASTGHTLSTVRHLSVWDISAETEQHEVDRLWDVFKQMRRQSGRFGLRRRDGKILRTQYAAAAQVVRDYSIAVHIVEGGCE